MKTCVSSYSFSKVLNSGKFNQLTLMEQVKKMGFDAIEFTDLEPAEGLTTEEFAKELRAESERISLPIVNYTIGADLLNKNLDEEVERLFKQVDIAAALGAKGMRHDATGGFKGKEKSYKGFDQALPVLVEGCSRVTKYAKEKGIKTMVENHGYFCQDSVRVERLVTGVADENFGLLLDMGNFACADDPSEIAFGRLAPFAKHVHCKDFYIKSGNELNPGGGYFRSRAGNYLKGTIVGHGNIPVFQCFNILEDNGYRGYLSIEFEGMEDPMEAMPIGLDNIKNMLEIL